MSKPQALIAAGDLRDVLTANGVPTTIELVEGRGGQGWYTGQWVATLGHHIVSARSQGLTPGLALVKRGRSDLPGPLCNGYGGFDEVARIICMGWANHAGQGGPRTVPAGTIPANNGRPYLFGWEFEGGLHESDWPASFHEFMSLCLGSTLEYLGQTSTEAHMDHKHWAEPPGRKSDRLGYTLTEARQKIGEAMAWKSNDGYTYADDNEWPPFEDAIKWAINTGLLKGSRDEKTKTGNFMADSPITRGQAAAVFRRLATDADIKDEIDD